MIKKKLTVRESSVQYSVDQFVLEGPKKIEKLSSTV